MNHSSINNQIDDLAKKLAGVEGLDRRLQRRNSNDLNQLCEFKNELEVADDLVELFGKKNVEFTKEEKGNRTPDIKVIIEKEMFIFEVTTIRKNERKECVRDYYELNKSKLWDTYVDKKQQLKGPFNILVIMTERSDFDIDTIMKFLFGGTSFEGTTLEEAIDKLIDGTFELGSKIQPIDYGFDDKEEWIKEALRYNIKGLIFRLLFEGLFSHTDRDLVAVAFNGISKDTLFINPFLKLDFDIKKLFFPKTT